MRSEQAMRPAPSRNLVVCGLHRSGTTFVGEILRRLRGFPVLHEPLNERFGVEGVPVAYPFVADEGSEYATLIDDIVRLQRSWSRIPRRGMSALHAGVFRLTGGKSGLRWDILRLRNRLGDLPSSVCWKDPFASLATPYLVRHWDARVVCMVRHPAAVHVSTARQGWSFDIANLRRQPELVRMHAHDVPEAHWRIAAQSDAASVALLWKLMIRVNSGLNDPRVKLVRHEDLCRDSLRVTESIAAHYGFTLNGPARDFVRASSDGKMVESQPGSRRDFNRNSAALADAWRSSILLSDLEVIRDIAGDELELIYPDILA